MGMGPGRAAAWHGPGTLLLLPLTLVIGLVMVMVVPVTGESQPCRAGESLVHGDIIIHGLFPYLGGDDCGAVTQFGRQLETAAEWAVRRVNSHGVLRGGVLGLRSYPMCTSSSSLATVVTTQAYTDSTDFSCVVGTFAGFLSPPLPAAAEALLSELPVTRALVPVTGGAALVETLAEVAVELGWTAVTVVTDDRGQRAARLVEHIEYLGICVTRWITITGRQLEAFSELSTLADDSCLVGLFEVSQLQLRQLGRLRCVLGLQRPEQLQLVPEDALVAFDTATEVPELTASLRERLPVREAWEMVVRDGAVTMASEAEGGFTASGAWRTEADNPEVEVWETMAEYGLVADEWSRLSKGQATSTTEMAEYYSTSEREELTNEPQWSTEFREVETGPVAATATDTQDLINGSDVSTDFPELTRTVDEPSASLDAYTETDTMARVQDLTTDNSALTEDRDQSTALNTTSKVQVLSTDQSTMTEVGDLTTMVGGTTDIPDLANRSRSTSKDLDLPTKSYTTKLLTEIDATIKPRDASSQPGSTTSVRSPTIEPHTSLSTQTLPAQADSTTVTLDLTTSASTLPTAWELTAPPTGRPPPFVPNPATVQVVRLVYNYARSLQLQLMRLCPDGACDAATVLRRASETYSDHGQEFVTGLDVTLTPDNLTVYRAGPGGARQVGWRSGGSLRLQPDAGLSGPTGAAAEPCPALFTQPVRWRVRVWTTVLATLTAVGALACLCFLCFYAAISCRRLEHSQGWMALLVAATLLQYAATAPFFLRRGRLVCALRLQAPALGLAAPLSVLLSRALCLAAAHTTRGDFGHVSGMLQITLCFFIFLVQVGISCERWFSPQWADDVTAHAARCSDTPRQQLMALSYVTFLQVLQFVLSPWVALCGRNYCEGPLTAAYTCLAALLWSGALTLFYLEVPLLDSDSAAPQLCLGMIVTASVSLVVVHVPRVLLLTREVSGVGALPHLRRYRDHSSSALADAAALRVPRQRRSTIEINEAIGLRHLDGGTTRLEPGGDGRTPPSPPPPPPSDVGDSPGRARANHEFRRRSQGGQWNHAFQPEGSVSVGDAETESAHSEAKYPTTEM